jgi:hypothetical protein
METSGRITADSDCQVIGGGATVAGICGSPAFRLVSYTSHSCFRDSRSTKSAGFLKHAKSATVYRKPSSEKVDWGCGYSVHCMDNPRQQAFQKVSPLLPSLDPESLY